MAHILEREKFWTKLIQLVKERPILWKKSTNIVRDRPLKIEGWNELAAQLNMDAEKLRRTWQNLIDQFRRDYKSQVRQGTKSRWRFFQDMSFLCETFTFRDRRVNRKTKEFYQKLKNKSEQVTAEIPHPTDLLTIYSPEDEKHFITTDDLSYETIAKQEPLDQDIVVENEPLIVEAQENTINSPMFKKSQVSTSSHNRSLRVQEVRAGNTVRKQNSPARVSADLEIHDEDYYFVMSLLPSLRQIPVNRKFMLRLGIMNLIAKDLEMV